ncbi:hypothetical protein EGI16_03560 [Chryseobacterium sp. G0240]|uniref:hypothetical protein n=1 Tax=Chryseobacterium sp. G0240 TaxID=2487066 RepID=UPI000F4550E8|nr:hypothetical protein [Chryseobacterium sp. G0240]ROI05476.1 hypothetical protein EGI16_03560 [Chryseobacterium sp. G0240]
MTKEQKIQEVIIKSWGDNWKKLHDDIKDYALKNFGFISKRNVIDWLGYSVWASPDLESKNMHFRPKSLSGIENNNGWMKIESEQDLPKDSSAYWIYRTDNRISNLNDYETDKKWLLPDLKATHYQPIEKPKPPIY